MSNGVGDAVGPAGGTRRQLRLAVLGPVLAWCGPEPLDLGPVRQQALLVALALRPDVTTSQQELLERVWGTEPPGTGGKVIPVYVHRLRTRLRAVGGGSPDSVIAGDRGGYRFLGRDVPTDLARLKGFAADADTARDSGDLDAAGGAFGRALELFRGEPLAGLPGPFARAERLRLAEQRVTLAQEKLRCQLRLGHYPEAVAELVALTATHPPGEPLAALLMRALYGSGRQVEALDVFTRVRHRLVQDLAVEPGEELRRAHQAVLRGDDGLLLGIRHEALRLALTHHVKAERALAHALSREVPLHAERPEGKRLLEVVKPGAESGETVSQHALGETVLCTPAVSDGAFYVRRDKHLWKFADK